MDWLIGKESYCKVNADLPKNYCGELVIPIPIPSGGPSDAIVANATPLLARYLQVVHLVMKPMADEFGHMVWTCAFNREYNCFLYGVKMMIGSEMRGVGIWIDPVTMDLVRMMESAEHEKAVLRSTMQEAGATSFGRMW
jgi:hypothetical protein